MFLVLSFDKADLLQAFRTKLIDNLESHDRSNKCHYLIYIKDVLIVSIFYLGGYLLSKLLIFCI